MEKINDLFDVKMMKKSIRWAMFVIFAGALVILKVEDTPTASHDLDSFTWSLWWSFTTVVTGGFADIYNPTTWIGQVITAVLVLSGMILIGLVRQQTGDGMRKRAMGCTARAGCGGAAPLRHGTPFSRHM